ncbi:hypothetical protein PVAND_002674 [Polypedilum vanderplanki]|uniref:Lipase domain-containing protein n=1 Tax=Polypedilum vanderplanki TaxID=319348 RepID=A0A9J6BRQ3_POLVA|nr:hypothetical protein PVAND_002674 [Polypedilum vanderplanki]
MIEKFKSLAESVGNSSILINLAIESDNECWIEDFTSESVQTIVSAYLQRDDHNIIVIDWGQYSFGFYYTVIPRFTAIAKIFARIMLDLFERGLDINTVHLVGHSFGSQFMGIAGRELQKVSMGKYKIKRISGLDPAHYGFFPSPTLENPLSSTDAEFVDSIHSDVTFIGTPYHTGQVNFYPNDGKLQPGCPSYSFRSYMQLVNSFCSHNHGWRYWAETLKPGKEQIFPAVLCKDYKDFIEDKCNENPINFMGYGATPSINDNSTGSYYIRLRSNVNFTVDDSYYLFLSTSLNYRSDLVRIVARLRQFFNQLSRN